MIQFLSQQASTGDMLVTLLPMVLILVFMFLIIYVPQKRQDKKDTAMRNSIEIGDKVTTIGGIVGIVFAISEKDDTLVVETGSDRTKIRFRRSAISSVEKLDVTGDWRFLCFIKKILLLPEGISACGTAINPSAIPQTGCSVPPYFLFWAE